MLHPTVCVFCFFLRLFYGCSTTIAIHESESLELSRALCSSGPTGAATAGIRRADGSAGRAVEVFRRQHLPAAVHEQGDVLPERGAEGGVRTNESQKRTNKMVCVFFHLSGLGKGRTRLACAGAVGFPVGLNIQVASLISTRFPQGAWGRGNTQ